MDKETYEKFISSLMSNDELEFKYKGIGYSIVHNPPYVYLGRNVSFVNKEYKTEKVESYLSIPELLDKVEIDGKKISEIWKDIEVSVI